MSLTGKLVELGKYEIGWNESKKVWRTGNTAASADYAVRASLLIIEIVSALAYTSSPKIMPGPDLIGIILASEGLKYGYHRLVQYVENRRQILSSLH